MTTPSLDTGTRLALDRTRLAYERTLMAWVRTATSLISFGFTIYKFFEFEAGRNAAAAASRLVTPRHFAMIMIGTGLTALLLSTIEHRRSMQQLRAEYGTVKRSIAAMLAAFISVLGLLAFIAAMFRG